MLNEILSKVVSVKFTIIELIRIRAIVKCWLDKFGEEYKKQHLQNDIYLLNYLDKMIIEKSRG